MLKPIKYTLPAYWASYLINGDASGIDEHNKKYADEFILTNKLPSPVDCGESYYSKTNDSYPIAGEVCEYTFLIEEKPQPKPRKRNPTDFKKGTKVRDIYTGKINIVSRSYWQAYAGGNTSDFTIEFENGGWNKSTNLEEVKAKALPLTITGEALQAGAVVLTEAQGLAIGLTDEILERGEWRGDLETVGGWQLPKSYRALCVSSEYETGLGYTKTKALTIHGLRTLTNPKSGGYALEGTVSYKGGRVRAFTSSQLFEWRGKLIDVATINACLPGGR